MISLLKSTRNIIRVSEIKRMRFSYEVQFSTLRDTHTRLLTSLLSLWHRSFHCKSCLHTHEVDQQHSAENRDDAIFEKQKSRRLGRKWPNSQFQTNCNGRRSVGSYTKPLSKSLFDWYSHYYSCEQSGFHNVFETRDLYPFLYKFSKNLFLRKTKMWIINKYAVEIPKTSTLI